MDQNYLNEANFCYQYLQGLQNLQDYVSREHEFDEELARLYRKFRVFFRYNCSIAHGRDSHSKITSACRDLLFPDREDAGRLYSQCVCGQKSYFNNLLGRSRPWHTHRFSRAGATSLKLHDSSWIESVDGVWVSMGDDPHVLLELKMRTIEGDTWRIAELSWEKVDAWEQWKSPGQFFHKFVKNASGCKKI